MCSACAGHDAGTGDDHDNGGAPMYLSDVEQPPRQRSGAAINEARDYAWRTAEAELTFERIISAGERGRQQHERLTKMKTACMAELQDAIAALPCCGHSESCRGHYQLPEDHAFITYVTTSVCPHLCLGSIGRLHCERDFELPTQAFFKLPEPRCVCSECRHSHFLLSGELQWFPATPSKAYVYFDSELLRLVSGVQTETSAATNAWAAALNMVHSENGCIEATVRDAMKNLSSATREWRRTEAAARDLSRHASRLCPAHAVQATPVRTL